MNNEAQLAELIKEYLAQRRDKKLESFYKNKPKKNKQGVITNGAINIRMADIINRVSPDKKEAIKVIDKSKKGKDQTPLDFQKQKYNQLLELLPKQTVDSKLIALQSELRKFVADLEDEFKPVNWLTEWTPKADDISFATHVAKLTHSSSKGTSILDATSEINDSYLTTNSLNCLEIDTASANAASLPIADILKLSANGTSVLDCIKSGNTGLFKHITDDEALINIWCENLKQAYDSNQKSSYFLNKQVYFPVANQQYHLLLPLVSSSLVHAVYQEHQKYYSEEATEARKQRKTNLYSPIELRSYPNKAVLHVTGSNHSNASALNGQRGGRLNLFASIPPNWQSSPVSVSNKSTIFDKNLSYRIKEQVVDLKKYLRVLKSKTSSMTSTSKLERNAAVLTKLTVISEAFFTYIVEIQLQQNAEGWTVDLALPIEQQLLLEPNREDDIAKSLLLTKGWLLTLSKSYARWLNRQLKDKQLTLSDVQAVLWREHFLLELKKFIASFVADNIAIQALSKDNVMEEMQ